MEEALTYWREHLLRAAELAGINLTDEQLETIAMELVVASSRAPEPPPWLPVRAS